MSLLESFDKAARAAFSAAGFPEEYGRVSESDRPDLAPFQCNGSMAAAGYLKKQGQKANPREIAEKISEALKGHADIEDLEIAGPGFINITPTAQALTEQATALASDPRTGASLETQKTIVIDYGGPNVAKPMHVGHLRSSVIGDSLKRMLRFQGHHVVGDIHLGDWGLQMGQLISQLRDEQPGLPYFDGDIVDGYPTASPVTIDDLSRIYPLASGKAKTDKQFMTLCRKATAELQAGRPGYRALLEYFITVSIAALKSDFDRLGVEFDLWKGEAAVDPLIPDMVQRFVDQGITEESEGALIIRVEEDDDKSDVPPLMLVSSTGAALYATTDMATILDRKTNINPDVILYVVDFGQSLHFEQVFRAADKAGLFPRSGLEHIKFGTVNGKDGKRFRTREGGALRLSDLITTATESAAARMEEAGIGADMTAKEKAEVARIVGLAALKFADLQNQRTTNYIFDIDRFTAFEGKTGPYLLYAAVRIKSLLRKAKALEVEPGPIVVADPAERGLVLTLDSFDRALSYATEKRTPHVLCDHVFRLAQSFSRFYTDCPILAESTPLTVKASRLALVQTTLRQLETGLDLLGIEIPERM